ncbi:hypothetical protein LT335_00365 [Spiroplasma sp. JKS002669]|uniref:hypothetical protein n=1 Tax=Spiroplasma attinicola TaxID=2904537 RepID=UPI002022F521|nr:MULTISPECIES: hypothetical protein [unclassified Spiroplasma]MCL6428817.1 hypothetical protein [Spiroplasma sp. JKS002669]MCL8210191.1 hypothetical protein [Spiroplasma sp. JKS002670]MCL8210698.1 hypothetical protein [Spiroplasma sp. JKS002671]
MALNVKKLRIAAILAMIISIAIVLLTIIYPFVNKVSDFWINFFIALALIEGLTFLNSVLFCLNPKKRVFISGIISLFALLIPGIIILFIYFDAQKSVKNRIQITS